MVDSNGDSSDVLRNRVSIASDLAKKAITDLGLPADLQEQVHSAAINNSVFAKEGQPVKEYTKDLGTLERLKELSPDVTSPIYTAIGDIALQANTRFLENPIATRKSAIQARFNTRIADLLKTVDIDYQNDLNFDDDSIRFNSNLVVSETPEIGNAPSIEDKAQDSNIMEKVEDDVIMPREQRNNRNKAQENNKPNETNEGEKNMDQNEEVVVEEVVVPTEEVVEEVVVPTEEVNADEVAVPTEEVNADEVAVPTEEEQIPEVNLEGDFEDIKDTSSDLLDDADAQSNGVINDMDVDKTDAGEQATTTTATTRAKSKSTHINKDIAQKVAADLKSQIAGNNMRDGQKALDAYRELNSRFLQFAGFVCRNDQKIYFRNGSKNIKSTDTTAATKEFSVSVHNAKPSKPALAFITGPKALICTIDAGAETLRKRAVEGLKDTFTSISEEDEKNLDSIGLSFSELNSFLAGYTVIDKGIQECPALLDDLFVKDSNDPISYTESRIVANISKFSGYKQRVLELKELKISMGKGVKHEKVTIQSVDKEIIELEKKMDTLRVKGTMSVIESTTRGTSGLLNRRNYVPLKKFTTVNPFTKAIDGKDADGKLVSDNLKLAYKKSPTVEVTNPLVFEGDYNKLLLPSAVVPVATKTSLYNTEIHKKSHWYTMKDLLPSEVHIAVRKESINQTTKVASYPFMGQLLNFSAEATTADYTIEDIENSSIVNIVGVENFTKIMIEAKLGITKGAGTKRGPKRIATASMKVFQADIMTIFEA